MFRFDKMNASKFYVAPSVERVVEFSPPNIDIENISKVLSNAVEGKCVAVNANDGFAEVDGRANFRLIYLDKEGMPKGVDYNADFTVKVDGEFDLDETLQCEIRVVDADVEVNGSLMLSAVLEVVVYATERDDVEMLCDAEQCYKTMHDIILPSFVAAKTVAIPVVDEVEVGQVGNILSVDASCIVKKTVCSENTLKLDACVYTTVTFTENEIIREKVFEIPIEEELNMDGVSDGDNAQVIACVRASKVVLQGVTDDNIIRFESDVQFKVQVFRCVTTQIVDDLFMLTNEISITKEKRMYKCLNHCEYYSERVNGTAMLGDNRAAARDIVALPCARCYTSKAVVSEDGLNVEGIVNTDIIYEDENGYNSVRTEIPFSLTISGEFGDEVRVICGIESISARVKRDREIEVNLVLGINACEYNYVGCEYISNVEIGDEKEQNTSALSMYIASNGDEMWDICKALTATPEDIIAQNPNLNTPLEEGERIIYFRKLNVDASLT